jgi:formamidopyrimidine-DNA glycosylase
LPEYPDIMIYIERLSELVSGKVLRDIRLASPFVLRSVVPPLETIKGKTITGFERIGKRIVFLFEKDIFLVIHLMISGRLHWRAPGCGIPGKRGLAALDFDNGTLLFTEAASKKRASMHIVRGEIRLADFDPGGIDVFGVTAEEFCRRLTCENHTLKRALTDPRLFSGIGNSYSDEILHRARLSPVLLTSRMTDEQMRRLYRATREVLEEWTDRLRKETGDGFPEKVTAFHDDMAVHGRYGKSCPVCGSTVQRIRYASNETNYCPQCQTGDRLLADRGLSRLLRSDWPRTSEELEDVTTKRRRI